MATGFLGAALIFGSPAATADPGVRPPNPPQAPHEHDTTPPTFKRVPRADGNGWVVCRPRARCPRH
ncbi:hypothetical protein D6158_30270 [Nocardia seriolae]|nr:hypothetical protein D6158_30270 [Nocardia seriolae]